MHLPHSALQEFLELTLPITGRKSCLVPCHIVKTVSCVVCACVTNLHRGGEFKIAKERDRDRRRDNEYYIKIHWSAGKWTSQMLCQDGKRRSFRLYHDQRVRSSRQWRDGTNSHHSTSATGPGHAPQSRRAVSLGVAQPRCSRCSHRRGAQENSTGGRRLQVRSS